MHRERPGGWGRWLKRLFLEWDRRKREFRVLDSDAQRFQEPKCKEYFHRLHRRFGGMAIHATFPQTEIQNCIIHQLHNSSKYGSYKGLRAHIAEMKAVCVAVDEPTALDARGTFGSVGIRNNRKSPLVQANQMVQSEHLL